MTMYSPERIFNAVAAICPDIQSYIIDPIIPDERRMWWEITCCILSSQVPYALAVAAADAIDAQGFLYKSTSLKVPVVSKLIEILSKPLLVEGKHRNYRFPIARAHQIAGTHSIIRQHSVSLTSLVSTFTDTWKMRSWLVMHAPGLGPKQASMFIRNIGISYELAILDRHVLNYMSALGIFPGNNHSISGLSHYCRLEHILKEHAEKLACPVGLLDWAIWIVMRVANQNKEGVLV